MESLDPRVIPLQRIQGALSIAVVAFLSLIGISIATLVGDDMPRFVAIGLFALWAMLAAGGTVFAITWPARAYEHMAFRIDDEGIEIRRGVYWRIVLNVPRSRVQHIDVSQGPVERRFGLGTLVIYTAGTEHARVELGGLEHGRALQIREQLLPSGTSDAV
jgi:membrane protein YdbS with pleckstrin-like domain